MTKPNEFEIYAPNYVFDQKYVSEFGRLDTDDTYTKNMGVQCLLDQIKGRWMVDGIMKTFIDVWDQDHVGSCVWWRHLFRRTTNPETIAKEDEEHFTNIQVADDVNDLGQLVVMIGMYCYGYPGNRAWGIYRDVLLNTYELDAMYIWEPIKFCIDFFHEAAAKKPHQILRCLKYVSQYDNAQFWTASNMLLDVVFLSENEDGTPYRYDHSCIKYAK